jgi:hypothetical protein
VIAWLCWAVESVGYWIRPYDMLADRRRWRWQPQQRCRPIQLQQPPNHDAREERS